MRAQHWTWYLQGLRVSLLGLFLKAFGSFLLFTGRWVDAVLKPPSWFLLNSTSFLLGAIADNGFSNSRVLALPLQIKRCWQDQPRWCVADRQQMPGQRGLLSGSARTLLSRCAFLPNLVWSLNYALFAKPDAWPKRDLMALREEEAIKWH